MPKVEYKKVKKKHQENIIALHSSAKRFHSAGKIDEIWDIMSETIGSILGYEFFGIGIVEGDEIRYIKVHDVMKRSPSEIRIPSTQPSITGRAFKTRHTQLVRDTRLDPDYYEIGFRFNSEITVPVLLDNAAVAVINIEAVEANQFTKDDQILLETLSTYATFALKRLKQIEVVRASEQRCRQLLESSMSAIIVVTGTKCSYANPKAAELLRYDSSSELTGKDILVTIHPEHRDVVQSVLKSKMTEDRRSENYEFKLVRKDGSIIDVSVDVSPIEWYEEPALLLCGRDITEQKKYEAKIEALHRHAAELESAEDIDQICAVTLDAVESVLGFELLCFLTVSDGGLRSIGNRGAPMLDMVLPLDSKGITVQVVNEKRSILVNDLRDNQYYVKGTTNSLSELAVPVMLNNEVNAVINIESLDLNAFTKLDQKLVETLALHVESAIERIENRRELKEQQELKFRELIEGIERTSGMIRHDIRGPLQTILNATYLLKNKPEMIADTTYKIERSVENVIQILEELKYITISEQLRKKMVNLNQLIQQSVRTAYIPEKIDVELMFSDKIVYALIDEVKIRRVIDNLIRNAVEAMPDGGVLKIRVLKGEEKIIIEVEDNGKGIPEEIQPNIFKPFFSTKPSGNGLGLMYCKLTVEAHKGSITYRSHEGEGTTFTLTLPIK